MNTSAKKQIIPELLAAVLWGILTLWTDRLFFRYDWRTTAFFVYKALFVLLAFLLVHGIVTLVKKLRAKDRFVWRWLQWTAVSGGKSDRAAHRLAGLLGQ